MRGRFLGCTLGLTAALLIAAAGGAQEAKAGTNPACDVAGSSGFAICLVETSPWQFIGIHAFHAAGTPYRYGAYNATYSVWQGGPWTRSSAGTQPAISKDPSWNWNFTVRHQVDNMGAPGVARYSATLY